MEITLPSANSYLALPDTFLSSSYKFCPTFLSPSLFGNVAMSIRASVGAAFQKALLGIGGVPVVVASL